jgi:hypothetical protein
MNTAQVRTDAATNTTNGFTGDFSDFVIASYLDGERAMTAEGAEAPGGNRGSGPGASVWQTTRLLTVGQVEAIREW